MESDNNQVFLRGRLSGDVHTRELPSGDEIAVFRVIVERPPGSRARVDTLDCAASAARARRVLARAVEGDELEVTGALHRRFWRGASGLASRYEVEVGSAKLTTRRRSGASPNQTRASA
jgi:single-strand DNA-binding protein